MSTSKHFDRICIIAVVVALLISILFMNGTTLGIQVQARTMEYEGRLFDTSKVHTIDIVIDDWDAFLSTAQSEEYSVCSVVIDGEAFKNVGIRGKGNTSLSNVASMDSDRYSFKIEFDQYDSTKSYYGLDKLSLNNLIQDNTMMKDYLTYQMMNEFGVAAPLCSYAYITVNGEEWGLYLAVEAVEESFLQRNFGSNYGDLYKPDSMSMGGGRGNGKDFNIDDFMGSSEDGDSTGATIPTVPNEGVQGGQTRPGGIGDPGQQKDGMKPGENGNSTQQSEQMMPGGNVDFSQMPTMPEGFDPSQMGGMMPGGDSNSTQQGDFNPSQQGGMMPGGNMGGGMDKGMGSSDTKLQYIDDQTSSYSNIFDSAKTDVSTADKNRLIASLKALGEGNDLESVLAKEDVIRYFVVHNYVVNADSYTGSMIHNYYLYEEDGKLSMIPWDYNLAFGTFQGGNAASMVNDDIDSPLSVTGTDRPMIDWIFDSEEYTALYHTYFQEFLHTVDVTSIISEAKTLISPYVENDPTKFCTYEEFETGVETLTVFCDLRSQSITAQLAGEELTVDASSITLSDMGTMNNGMGGDNGQMPSMPGNNTGTADGNTQMPTMPDNTSENSTTQMPQMPDGQGGMQMPGQDGSQQMPGQSGTVNNTSSTDETTADNQQIPGFGGQGGMERPEGMEMPEGMEIPEGMGNMQHGQNGNSQGGFPDRGQTGTTPTQGNNQWVLLAVTMVILAAGLLFAFKFKR